MHHIRRSPEGADSICRNVKDEDLKIKIKIHVMEDVDHIYNLCLRNIILYCFEIVLIPFSLYIIDKNANRFFYVCVKILCFSIAIICFVQVGLYWEKENTNKNEEDSGDEKSTFMINKECFVDHVDPINNFKLKMC